MSRHRKHPKFLKCEYCGKEYFARYAVQKGVPRRFCSLTCKLLGYKLPKATCPNCGKSFGAKVNHEGRQKFCCIACYRESQKANILRVTIVCERCLKSFEVFPSRLIHGNPRFCSGSCAGNIRRGANERFRRVKSPEWLIIRKRIILRDGAKCSICKSTKGLSVHHIIPWRISRDDSDNNLITLCRSCHYKVEWCGYPCPSPLFTS